MAKNWLITIGINHYDNLQSLRYAKKDAQAIKGWCETQGSFDRIFLFTEDSPEIEAIPIPIATRPTYGKLRRFLRAQFERPLLGTGDNLWFFFAGHGKQYQDRDYLMLSDSDPGAVDTTALSVTWVADRLKRSGADNVVLWMDACRSEGKRGDIGIGLEKQQGVITFYGCSPGMVSYEIEELEQGAFTYALLEVLQKKGTGNYATVERLYQRLRYRVAQLVQHYENAIQTPYAVVEPATKYHFILLPQQATFKDAETLKSDAWREERKKNYPLAEQLWIRILAISPADPDAIDAIRDIAKLNLPTDLDNRPLQHRGRPSHSRESTVDQTPLKPIFKRRQLPLPQIFLPQSATVKISRRLFLKGLGWTGVGIVIIGSGKLMQLWSSPSEESIQTTIANPSDLKPSATLPSAATERKTDSTIEFQVITVNNKGEEINRETNQTQYLTENVGNDVNIDMILIPGGKFMMGAAENEKGAEKNEFPQHEVTIASFYMSKFLITQEQWKVIASQTDLKTDITLNTAPSRFKGNENPVEKVNWFEAVEFCQRLSKQTGKRYELPSEGQWEYACRAMTRTPFNFGATLTGQLANYNAEVTYAQEKPGTYRGETTKAGIFPANAFGLYDMHGNVWEWCLDHWHDNYEDAPKDGIAWIEKNKNEDHSRILRGGSWDNSPVNCRSALRHYDYPHLNRNSVGFRVVLIESL